MSNEQKVTRKLRAILSADVKGYSLLMADDEVHTIQTLKAYRSLMSDLIYQHSGRVVDNPGDNLLSEFSSAVDAVECALQIQNRLKKENAKFVEDKQLQFRIGINIGDVVQDGDRIYGEGVNIAARIEGLAEPGGICISRNAHDHIKDKLNFGYEYLGDHEVKNIKDPVRVYKVLMAPEDAGKLIGEKKKRPKLKWLLISAVVFMVIISGVLGGIYWKYFYLPAPTGINTEMNFELPKGPSIAVLPFDNMTGDPKQDYLCDGITEHIISTLSYVPELFIIARNSTFAYKRKHLNIQQIGKELNANWVIEGSIQLSKERIRITVQLIDATSGHHKWSETYDRELNEIFKLQDEIALAILKEMQIKLAIGESARNMFDGINTPQEYKKALKIWSYFNSHSVDSMELARKEIPELIDMNPNTPVAYTALSHLYIMDIWNNQCDSNLICIGKAIEANKKALSLNENYDWAYLNLGYIFLMKREHENALNALKKAITLNPNNAWAYDMLGFTQIYADQLDHAIDSIKKAFRLNPIPPAEYYFNLGYAFSFKRMFSEAIELYYKSLEINPDFWPPLGGLVCVYGHLGDLDKAKSAISELYKVFPNFKASRFLNTAPFKSDAARDFWAEGLQKAGLLE